MSRFPYDTWNLVAWCVWAAMFFTLEGIGLARGSDATLTALIRNSVPGWCRAMFIGWLAYHFLIQK